MTKTEAEKPVCAHPYTFNGRCVECLERIYPSPCAHTQIVIYQCTKCGDECQP